MVSSTMGVALSERFQQILKQRSYGHLATIMPDGSPQVTLVWVDTDGRHVPVNTVDGNQKVKNLRRDDRVAMTVSSPGHPAAHIQLRGRVVDITSEGARSHVEALSQIYYGGPYPLHHLGPRVILKIEPTRVQELMIDDASGDSRDHGPSSGGSPAWPLKVYTL
jgi:PPOX class probable F420-dependent enzyme